jgi:hypothetical protein
MIKPFELLQIWKQKPYQKSNYENIHICYDDQKYIRMKPKTQITISDGFMEIILKQPKDWLKQHIQIEGEVTLCNDTHNVIYYTLKESLISDDDKECKLHVKNGVPKDNEKWLN